ncbi:hypothetical protein Tco_1148357 [Tanacetum coccineum]
MCEILMKSYLNILIVQAGIILFSKPKAITPNLPIEEPDNSLIMGDEHLDSIPETELDEVIMSSVENLILSILTIDGIRVMTMILEGHRYVWLTGGGVNDVDQEEKEFDLEDILQIQGRYSSLPLGPISPSRIVIRSLRSPITLSLFRITLYLSSRTFRRSYGMRRRQWLSTSTHANNSLPEYDLFLIEGEPDQGGFISIVIFDNSNDSLLELLLTQGDVRLMLKLTIPSHLSLGLFFCISLTLRFLPNFPPPIMRTPFLTPTSLLRISGISSGWNFHELKCLSKH